ncbi:MAG: T9SS type A sorting domain-containing protein [Lentimicrobiaceae bacterium]|nr:T9SS type A sorting domain-containing protein [Lentimicrobiaceae bacterium]
MKVLVLVISIILTNSFVFGQWVSLGVQGTNVLMLENNLGYKFTNAPGPTPSTGITYTISSTQNDWQSSVTTNTGGGGDYGCCAINNLSFINFSTGIRSRNYQGIYSFQKTNDEGFNWSNFSNVININIKDMILVNDTTGYVSGNSYGTNHGILYRLSPTSSLQLIYWDTLFFTNTNIEFLNSITGFVIMNDTNQNSHLFKTNNSGGAWNKVFSDTTNNLTSISFPDSTTGYICSTNGNIFKTIDGGTTWSQALSPSTNNINSIDFINDTVGYIVCDGGEIYRTTDGAISWNNELSGTTSNLIKIQMVDINTAYCISEDGVLLKNGNVMSIGSLSDYSNSPVIISPNPTSELIKISLPNDQLVENVELYKASGNHVLSRTHNEVDISGLDSGLYIIKAFTGERYYTSKFIKK